MNHSFEWGLFPNPLPPPSTPNLMLSCLHTWKYDREGERFVKFKSTIKIGQRDLEAGTIDKRVRTGSMTQKGRSEERKGGR